MSTTCDDAVRALKDRGLRTSASGIAEVLKTSSRAVATALRGAVMDGRVTIVYKRGVGFYLFKRLKAKKESK